MMDWNRVVLYVRRPKHPLSAYNLFFRQERARLIAENRGVGQYLGTVENATGEVNREMHQPKSNPIGTNCKSRSAELVYCMAARWRALDPVSKAQFEESARQDKVRYETELLEWKAHQVLAPLCGESSDAYGTLDLAHRVFRSASCNERHLGTPETKAVFARNDDVVTNFHHPASPFVPNHFGTFHAAASDAVLVHVPVAGPKSCFPNSTNSSIDALAHFQSLSDIWMDENSSGSMKPSSTLRAPTLQLSDQTKPSYTCNIEHLQWTCAQDPQFLHQPVTEVAPFYAVIPTNPSKRPKSCWFYPVDELDEHDEWM
jgi:HMG-box domain